MAHKNWYTEFYHQVRNGSVTSVERTIWKKPAGANIDAKGTFNGLSALEYIIYRNGLSDRDVQVLKLLFANGADPLQKGKKGILTYYSFANHGWNVTSEFLKNISDIDTILNPKDELNALECCIALGDLSGMKYCLSRGANPNKLHCIGITRPIWPTASKVPEVKKELQETMVKLLIEYGANINLQKYYGVTPLHYALMHNWKIAKEITIILLKQNPDVNLADDDGFTPMYFAIRLGRFDIELIKTFLKHGSDPNRLTGRGSNNLHLLAIMSGYATLRASKIAEILIEYGASVNHQDHFGNIPLYYAVQKGYPHLVEKFLQHGADITIRNNIGVGFIDLFSSFSEKVSKLMLKHFCILLQDNSSNFRLNNTFISTLSTTNELRAMY